MSTAEVFPYIEFDEAEHAYYVNGERVISVTQVLESVGVVDPDWFTEEQRIRGTLVHLLVAMNNTGKVPSRKVEGYGPGKVDEAMAYFAQWREFRKKVKFEVLAAEEMVFDPIHRVAGRLDVRCRMFGEEWIIDVKTNRAAYVPAWAKWQTAAYAHAQNPINPARRACVVLTPEKFIGPIEFPVAEYLSDRDDFHAFVRTARAIQITQGESQWQPQQ